jgi:hypothetical protein
MQFTFSYHNSLFVRILPNSKIKCACVIYLLTECQSFAPTARASSKNKNKNIPWIQYQLCILTFSVYMCIQRMEKLLMFESMVVEGNGAVLGQGRNGHFPPTRTSTVTRGSPRGHAPASCDHPNDTWHRAASERNAKNIKQNKTKKNP